MREYHCVRVLAGKMPGQLGAMRPHGIPGRGTSCGRSVTRAPDDCSGTVGDRYGHINQHLTRIVADSRCDFSRNSFLC